MMPKQDDRTAQPTRGYGAHVLRALRRQWRLALAVVLILSLVVAWLLARQQGLPIRGVVNDPARGIPLAFSPQGGILVLNRESGGVALWDVAANQMSGFWPGSGTGHAEKATFSPDGRSLVVGESGPAGRFLAILEPDTGNERAVIKIGAPGIWSHRFSADSQTVTILLWDPNRSTRFELRTYQATNGNQLLRHAIPIGEMALVALSADAETLATVDVTGPGRSTVALRDVSTGAVRELLPETSAPNHEITSIEFAPDEPKLALGRGDGTVELWDLARDHRRFTLGRHTSERSAIRIAFGPGGMLASEGYAGKPAATTGRIVGQVFTWIDSRGVYKELPEVIVWDYASGRHPAVLRHCAAPVFSPDGHTLASFEFTRAGTVFWDLPEAVEDTR
jgi:WD40 repeat protein